MHLPALLLGVRQISGPRMNHHPLHKHAHTCIFTLLFFIKILYDKVWPPPLSVTELSFCRCLSLWSLCVYPVPKEMKTCIWGLTTPCSPPKNKLKEKTSGSLFHRLLVKGEFTACLEGWQMGNWTLHVGVGRGRPAALRGCHSSVQEPHCVHSSAYWSPSFHEKTPPWPPLPSEYFLWICSGFHNW